MSASRRNPNLPGITPVSVGGPQPKGELFEAYTVYIKIAGASYTFQVTSPDMTVLQFKLAFLAAHPQVNTTLDKFILHYSGRPFDDNEPISKYNLMQQSTIGGIVAKTPSPGEQKASAATVEEKARAKSMVARDHGVAKATFAAVVTNVWFEEGGVTRIDLEDTYLLFKLLVKMDSIFKEGDSSASEIRKLFDHARRASSNPAVLAAIEQIYQIVDVNAYIERHGLSPAERAYGVRPGEFTAEKQKLMRLGMLSELEKLIKDQADNRFHRGKLFSEIQDDILCSFMSADKSLDKMPDTFRQWLAHQDAQQANIASDAPKLSIEWPHLPESAREHMFQAFLSSRTAITLSSELKVTPEEHAWMRGQLLKLLHTLNHDGSYGKYVGELRSEGAVVVLRRDRPSQEQELKSSEAAEWGGRARILGLRFVNLINKEWGLLTADEISLVEREPESTPHPMHRDLISTTRVVHSYRNADGSSGIIFNIDALIRRCLTSKKAAEKWHKDLSESKQVPIPESPYFTFTSSATTPASSSSATLPSPATPPSIGGSSSAAIIRATSSALPLPTASTAMASNVEFKPIVKEAKQREESQQCLDEFTNLLGTVIGTSPVTAYIAILLEVLPKLANTGCNDVIQKATKALQKAIGDAAADIDGTPALAYFNKSIRTPGGEIYQLITGLASRHDNPELPNIARDFIQKLGGIRHQGPLPLPTPAVPSPAVPSLSSRGPS